jgi:hypothetical protein
VHHYYWFIILYGIVVFVGGEEDGGVRCFTKRWWGRSIGDPFHGIVEEDRTGTMTTRCVLKEPFLPSIGEKARQTCRQCTHSIAIIRPFVPSLKGFAAVLTIWT